MYYIDAVRQYLMSWDWDIIWGIVIIVISFVLVGRYSSKKQEEEQRIHSERMAKWFDSINKGWREK